MLNNIDLILMENFATEMPFYPLTEVSMKWSNFTKLTWLVRGPAGINSHTELPS